MDLSGIVALFGQQHLPGDEMTGAFLDDAVASFSTNPAGVSTSIRQLQKSDPSGFVLAAVRLLTSTEERSPGVQYVAGLVFAGNLLTGALVDERILAEEAAIALARHLASAQPLLDVRLIQKMLVNAGGSIRAVKAEVALRVLTLVGAISDCSHLAPYLIQILHHPNALVRSKVALLLGRANLNLTRIKMFLTSEDPQFRAHAVQSMWGRREKQVVTILWEASADSHTAVAINALAGLCQTGDRDAYRRLLEMCASHQTEARACVAWAMGEIGDAEFAGPLNELLRDEADNVREMAAQSLKKLSRVPEMAA